MKFAKSLLSITAILTVATITSFAQAAAQAAPAKVGFVRSAAFSQTNGITRLTNALRVLDSEFQPRRSAIAQLITRINELQTVPAGLTETQRSARRDQLEALQIELTRKQEDARADYMKRFGLLTDPIQKSVVDSLRVFAKARGLDVVVDLTKFPDGILLVNENADMTSAFIRDFNSKNP